MITIEPLHPAERFAAEQSAIWCGTCKEPLHLCSCAPECPACGVASAPGVLCEECAEGAPLRTAGDDTDDRAVDEDLCGESFED